MHATSVRELRGQLETEKAAREIAESTIVEMRLIMGDLLGWMGTPTTCAKCDQPVFWLRRHSFGKATMYNPDGSQHWPRCKGTARPEGG